MNYTYVLDFTDSSQGSFAVAPYTANGPATPAASTPLYFNTDTGITATGANTSLVFVGKGVDEYGAVIQENILHLLENFSNSTRPQYPIRGQLWHKSSSVADPTNPTDPSVAGLYIWNTANQWQSVVLSASASGSLFDAGGNRIVNVGTATQGTDALNLSAAEAMFVPFTGGTVTGPLVLSQGAQSVVAPISPNDLANKTYVDTLVSAVQTAQASLLNKTGDTVTGTITFSSTANLVFASGNSLTFGGRVLGSVGTPSLQYDAANKAYVDIAISNAISGLPTSTGGDGVVVSGSLDSTSGVLTLVRSVPLAPVVVSGNFAPFNHTQSSTTITYDQTSSLAQSYLVDQNFGTSNYPIATQQTVVGQLDQRIYQLGLPFYRNIYLIPATDPGTAITSIVIGTSFPIEYNRVQVFINGTKSYQTMRGITTVAIYSASQTVGLNSPVGAAAGTYSVSIGANGSPPSVISITLTGSSTISDLVSLLNAGLASSSVPVSVDFIASSASAGYLRFASNAVGAAAAGYQIVAFVSPITSSIATGLANDSTSYTATVTIDGTAHALAITGSTAQTFGTLVSEINTQLGNAGTAALQNYTNLVITSASTGNSSSVNITTPGTLFSSLTIANNLLTNTKIVAGHAASAVSVSYAAGELLTAIPNTHSPQGTTVQTTQGWYESGAVGGTGNSVNFSSPLALGSTVEVTVFN